VLKRNALAWGWWPVLGVIATFPQPLFLGDEPAALAYWIAGLWLILIVMSETMSRPSPIDLMSGTRSVVISR
jgi:hypothetical protein